MVDKRPIGYIPGKGNPLDKKVPKAKKYTHVTSTLNTGPTIKDINIMSDAAVAKRKNELFKRVKTSTVSMLLKQDRNFESIYNIGEEFKDFPDNLSMRSAQSIQSQATQMSAVTYATERLGITDDTCFLLLDIREPEDFLQYHIREAINLPAPNVSRDKFIPAIYRFKNQPDKLIIIYHQDERNGMPIATKFAEKGFENVFLLSGGIEKFLQEFPEEVQGTNVPAVQVKPTLKTSMTGSSVAQKDESKSVISSKSSISNVNSQRPSQVSMKPSMLSNAGKSILSKIDSVTPSDSQSQSRVIVKRSNFKEYPQTGDVKITKDSTVEKEIQAIINQSNMKSALSLNNASQHF